MMMFSPGDGRALVLVHFRGAPRSPDDGLAHDARHFAFAEASARALARWRRKLDANDVQYWEEDHGAQQSIYFSDPNGMILEITAPPTRAGKVGKRSALAAARRWIAAL